MIFIVFRYSFTGSFVVFIILGVSLERSDRAILNSVQEDSPSITVREAAITGLESEHKSKLKQAEEVNDLMLLERRPRPRMCRQEYKEPQEEFREVWETGGGKAAQAKSLPAQPKQQRKRRARAASAKEPKEKKPKEEDHEKLERQKEYQQRTRQIQELQQQLQQTNQAANSFNKQSFEEGARQAKESLEWGISQATAMNKEAAALNAERAKLQHQHYLDTTRGPPPAQSQGQRHDIRLHPKLTILPHETGATTREDGEELSEPWCLRTSVFTGPSPQRLYSCGFKNEVELMGSLNAIDLNLPFPLHPSIYGTMWKRRTPFFGPIITAADGGFSHAQLLHYTHKTFRSFGHVSMVAFSDPNDLRLLCGRRHDARKKKTATRAPTLPPHSRKTQTSTPEAAKSHVCSDTKTPRAGRCEQR
ncbi:hypothetical protein AURANDRAFT_67474 [Aureococcus anophagefferens]|uniref:Uncharacterized protein n=1 Tax=Aureococcus anophagefferens TaxID=44056 RepID=F0YLA1_AURAN|nr:hypothetical protein AURANDRAFT_67474 [Aureococcus anophagefferens]EGB04118.1 hypothetical protein AURANDRAFT_67474 [Aureococcus anophagefferens]|eukprot:XP_009041243.1 hypothetical protein AURANDRAFT_67474 [Aureococcus anophagefferens]